ncbi:MAG: outer membrane protein assembly factor BamB, contains PQQ-like beta-propeller repeat [Verrucomicrobiaceae bacterium]|nr:outer membrane protein assembly factor BamB, contains PQQ-like beta-propeller repeat [Verrucomicrobiaceae bacterium]
MRVPLILAIALSSRLLAGAESPPPALPAPVASFGAAASPDGNVFIYGGHAGVRHSYSRDEVNGDLYAWQQGQSAWKKLGSDEPAQGASLIVLPGQVLRIGGMAAHNAKGEKQDLWSSETATFFDLKSQGWKPLAKLPERRSSHDSVVIGHTLYVIGGWSLGGGNVREGASSSHPHWHDTYLTLDLSKPGAAWESHPQPFKRRGLAVHAIGTKLFAIGGMSSGDEPTSSVDVLDTVSGLWSEGPELPAEKLGGFGFSAIGHEGRLFASGVVGELLELKGDQWQPIGKLAYPRFFHRLVPGGADKLIALGGENRKGEKAPPEIIELPAADAIAPPAEKPKAATSSTQPAASTLAWTAHPPAAESDWPGYQGPRCNSTTPEVGWNTDWSGNGPAVAWQFQAGSGLASFAVVGSRVYAAGNDGKDQDTIWCLDLASGKQLWRHTHRVPTKSHEMAIVPNGPAATPAVHDGRLYAISREGGLLCLDAVSGQPLWQKHLIKDLGGKRPVYGYAGSPTIVDGRLYLDIGGTGKSTTCLNASTGDVVWQTGDGEAGYSTPVVVQRDGRTVLMLFKGEALELRSATDGALIAAHATTTRDFCNAATPVLAGDIIFISHTGNMGARALDWKDKTLTERWTDRDLGLLFHSGMPWGQNLLVFNDQQRGGNDLRLIDLTTGKSLWQSQDVPRGTGLLCDDGHAILLTNQGEVVLARVLADHLDIEARVQALPPKCWSQPVLSHRHLLCKNNAGAVICYRL